jgi:transglutaminase-like putative cysteine protease
MKLVVTTLRAAVLFLFFAFLVITNLQAQAEPDVPIKFGKLTDADKNLTKYDKDPDASALILCDYGKTRITYDEQLGFHLEYTRHRRIKIFKQEGAEYANNQLILALGREKITTLKATSYNLENGRWVETKMDKTSIFEEKYNINFKQIKFTIPNVKEESIIEYEYKYTSESFRVRDWYFQGKIPCLYSEYRLAYPVYFGYKRIFQGYTTPKYTVNEHRTAHVSEAGVSVVDTPNPRYDYDYEMYRWAEQDVPAFKDETYIASSENYSDKIEFQLAYYQFPGKTIQEFFSNWTDLVGKLAESDDFGKRLKKSNTTEELVKQITQGKTDPKDQVKAIYEYVKSTFKWNEIHDCTADQSVKELLQSKTGSSGDINLCLINLLKTNGLEAHPVLLSTRSNGLLNPAYPILSSFNEVIALVKIGTTDILLDATNPVRPMNMLPYTALNGQGFLANVIDRTFSWVSLQNSFKATSYMSVETSIDTDNQLLIDLATVEKGYDALDAMKTIKAKNEATFFKETYKKLIANGKIIAQQAENNGTEVFTSKVKIATNDYLEATGDLLYINPMLAFGLQANPFKALERHYPIDFAYPKETTYQFSLAIPKGYKVLEVPKAIRLAWQDGSLKFDYAVEVTEQKINIKSKISLKTPVFMPENYPQLREFYGKITAKHAEQIVFTKIK